MRKQLTRLRNLRKLILDDKVNDRYTQAGCLRGVR